MNYVRVGGYIPPQPIEDYNDLPNIPVHNQDLTASGFTPVANSYYRHTGATTDTFTQGVIYLYNGTGYAALDGAAVNNGTLTIQKNGTNVQTFTANQSGNVTANITVPTKVSELTNDSGFLTTHQDISGLMPKSGGTFTGEVKFGSTENFQGYYIKRMIGSLGAGTRYADLDSSYKDGTYHRMWRLRFPSGSNFWGKIKITLYGNYSSFNASGVMSKSVTCNFNTSNIYNNVGCYDGLGVNVEQDFRISEAIWNATASAWEILIWQKNLSGNNSPVIMLECWTTNDTKYINAFNGITAQTVELTQSTSYSAQKASSTGGTKTVEWATLPVYENPLGEEIATVAMLEDKQDKITSSNKLSASLVSGLSTVATSGSYNDLSDKPTIPDISGKLDKSGGTVTGDLTVGGNLTVNGTTTTVDSTTLQVKDKLIEVAHGNTAALTTPAGLVAPKYDGTNSGALVFDSTGTAYVGDVTLKDGNIDVANSGLQPLATRTGLVGGNLVQYDSSALTLKDSGKKISDLALKTDLNSKANLSGGNTFNDLQTINAPTNASGSEQTTMKVKTSNGGAIIFGKEGANSGTMIRLDQADGTCRLRFRSSKTAGAMVWEQPEQGAKLHVDLGKDGSDKHRVTFPSGGGTLALTSQIHNGTLTIQQNGTDVATFTANQSTNATANITVPTKVSELTNDSGYTTNTGTVTSVAVKMNNVTKGTVTSSGTIDLGTVLTEHQDISGKANLSGGNTFSGNQVITGALYPEQNAGATFGNETHRWNDAYIQNSINLFQGSDGTPNINVIRTGLTSGTNPTGTAYSNLNFGDVNGKNLSVVRSQVNSAGRTSTDLWTRSFGTDYGNYVGLFAAPKAGASNSTDVWHFSPNLDAIIDLGQSNLRWRNIRAVNTYSNVYGSDLCSTGSLRLKDPNIIRGTNQAANGGKQNYYRAININDKNNKKGVAVEWGYLCEKNSNGNTTKHVSELNFLVYPPNTTDNANFVKVALGKRSDGTTYFTYAGDQVITTKNFSLSGTTLTITL